MIREVAVQDLAKVADGDGTDFADSFVRLAGLRSIDRAPYNVGASVTDLLVGGPHEDEPNGVDVVDGVGFEVGREAVSFYLPDFCRSATSGTPTRPTADVK